MLLVSGTRSPVDAHVVCMCVVLVWGLRVGWTYDLEGVGNDADGHQLLAVVAAVGHQGVGQTLDDGAVGLAEPLDGISAGRVRQVDGVADLDVVAAKPNMLACRAVPLRAIKCEANAICRRLDAH